METNEKPGKATITKWQDVPSDWKLGIFYFNWENKHILPPKRLKAIGWTMNFAYNLSYLTFLQF